MTESAMALTMSGPRGRESRECDSAGVRDDVAWRVPKDDFDHVLK